MSETKNKVLYGIENVHAAVLTENTDGSITYGKPFKVPGATGFSPDPQGDEVKFHADNIVFFKANSNQGYQGDLVLAITPEEFLTQILGQTKDTNGAVIESANDKQARFALLFEGKGDAKARRFVYWDCTASRPSRENQTQEESINVGTESLQLTITPRTSDKLVKAYIEPSTANKAVYDTFFEKVYEKDATVAEV